ncbi:MAG: cytochrome c biogenesis protein CcsA [Acidobacteriota bacterium]
MESLARLYLPGALTLWCALAFALAALWGYSLVLRGTPGDPATEESRLFARRAYRFFAFSIVLCAAVMMLLLARRDFRVEYVQQYSGLDLPWYFQLAAFWAGQKGSFLIWLLWGSLIGVILLRALRNSGRDEAPVMSLYTLTMLGLLFILVRENPFLMLGKTPVDGSGLNPLLQDNWMVIHPPIMFVGFALAGVPFAFAMSALWRRDFDRWATRAFPWALGGFLVLGTAILMGGYWAYKTLGWGGYWGWDPVENASLVPWLFFTALVHGLYMERTRGRFRRSNYVLAALTYLSVLYGTFLTRSGVLADFSVHSFVDLGISGWLIGLMGFFVILAVGLIALRLREVKSEPNADPFLSRGAFLMMGSIAITTCALVVLFGTSAPLLTRLQATPGQVGPSFYNRVNLPIALLVAFLLGMVPYLTWRGADARTLLRKLVLPGILALVAGAVAIAAGVHEPLHVLFVFLAALAVGSNLQKTIEKVRFGGMASSGGYLTHVGVGIILIGILASSGYDHGTKVTLERGKPTVVDDLTLTFIQSIPKIGRERERMEVAVTTADGSTYFAYPKIFLNERTQQMMVNPHIKSSALQDVYISPLEYDPGQVASDSTLVQLTKGESAHAGAVEVRFEGFDLQAEGNALAQMQSGEPVTIGAVLAVNRTGVEPVKVRPLYRFRSSGEVETPPLDLPGGGIVAVRGINATAGAIQLELSGVGGAMTAAIPARLSLDVTRKPLIQMVWFGLYVVLAGGLLAAAHRVRQARTLDALQLHSEGEAIR